MAGKKFKALENGTLSNPYRFVQKGHEIELNDEEAEFFIREKCTWLVPLKVANAIVEPPLMSHMNITADRVSNAMDAINQLPVNDAYNTQMKTIVEGERAADKIANEINAAAQGTGNLDPLGAA